MDSQKHPGHSNFRFYVSENENAPNNKNMSRDYKGQTMTLTLIVLFLCCLSTWDAIILCRCAMFLDRCKSHIQQFNTPLTENTDCTSTSCTFICHKCQS